MKTTCFTYKYFKLLSVMIFAMLFGMCAFRANAQLFNFTKTEQASSSCKKVSCNNSTCALTLDNKGHLSDVCPSGTRYDVDPNCVMNQNAQAGSCIDTMPVASINRVSETNCYRANGAGGNSKPRNHLGTDYAATEGTVITAAADGQIVYAKPMEGGGRIIIMEHQKSCPCTTSNCDDKYITVYMHLSGYIQTGGYVKKGTPIGYVGGSNYKNSTLYDPPHKKAYGPHLHFEIHSGSFAEGYNTVKSSIINPLCDDIQSFCGGCSNTVKEQCTDKTNTNEWTQLSEEAAQEKSVLPPPANMRTTTGLTGAMPAYQDTSCDYQNFELPSDSCLFCPMFKALFNTASALAKKTYNSLKDGIVNVVIVAFALWIAIYILKQVSAFELKEPKKIMQELLVQAFKVLFVVLVLKTSYAQILKLTIDPIFNTSMHYIQALTETEPCSPSAPYMENLVGYEDQLNDNATGALPISMGQNILCSIKNMQQAVWRIVAYGRECRCIGWRIKAYIKFVIPNLSYVITGDLLIIAGLLLLLAFPWCLVDSVLNMAVACALLPAAIGAWAFKITSGYLKKLFDYFLNAMFTFVFLTLFLYIIITQVDLLLQDISVYASSYEKLINPIEGIAFWGIKGTKLIMICLLGWVFLDNAKGLADEFAKAPALNIGQKTGGLSAQVGSRVLMGRKGADGKRHGGIAGLARQGGELGGLAAQRFVITPIRQSIAAKRADRIRNSSNSSEVKDASGNVIGHQISKRNIFGQKVTKTVSSGGVYTKERKRLIGKRTVSVTKDAFLTVRGVKDADGNTIRQNFKFRVNFAKYMIDRNGRIDTDMVANLQARTNLPPEMINMAISNHVMQDRGIALSERFLSRSTVYENGVLTVIQKNVDGSVTRLSTEMVGSQMLVKRETVDAKGNIHKVVDNGIIRQVVSQKNGHQATEQYSFDKHILDHTSVKHLMNYNNEFGRLAPVIDRQAAMLGLTEEHMKHFAEQERSHRLQNCEEELKAAEKAQAAQNYFHSHYQTEQMRKKVSDSLTSLNKMQAELSALQTQGSVSNTGRINFLANQLSQLQNSYANNINDFHLYESRENTARDTFNALF